MGRRTGFGLRPYTTAIIFSTIGHAAALAAVVYFSGRFGDDVAWRRQISQGRNSESLSATASPSAATSPREPVVHVQPQTNDQRPLPMLDAGAASISRRKLELPRKPEGVLPRLAVGEPALARRPARDDETEPPTMPDELARPASRSRPTVVARLIEAEDSSSSAASFAGAASSSGAVNGIPGKVFHVKPIYPVESTRAPGEEGVVKLRIRLDRSGNVVEAAIHTSSGYARLDRAALAAAHQWKYEPTGASAAAVLEFVESLEFRLDRTPAQRTTTR